MADGHPLPPGHSHFSTPGGPLPPASPRPAIAFGYALPDGQGNPQADAPLGQVRSRWLPPSPRRMVSHQSPRDVPGGWNPRRTLLPVHPRRPRDDDPSPAWNGSGDVHGQSAGDHQGQQRLRCHPDRRGLDLHPPQAQRPYLSPGCGRGDEGLGTEARGQDGGLVRALPEPRRPMLLGKSNPAGGNWGFAGGGHRVPGRGRRAAAPRWTSRPTPRWA